MDRIICIERISASLATLESLVAEWDLDENEEWAQLSHVGICVLSTMNDITDYATTGKIEMIGELAEAIADQANWQKHERFVKRWDVAPDQRGGSPLAGFENLETSLGLLRTLVDQFGEPK